MTATNFILSSDRTLKTNITAINTDLSAIEFVEFEMKADLGRKRYGVIAQDVEKIAPHLVYTDENGIKSVGYIDLLIAKIAKLEQQIKQLQDGNSR